jgi:hypothetical protein
MCVMGSAEAHEVQLGVDQRLGVQSNLFTTAINETASGFYQVSPRLILSQPESDFTYNLEYQPSYRVYFNVDGVNGWDQVVRGRAKSQINARDAVRLDGEFLLNRSIRSIGTFDSSGQPLVVANGNGTNQRFVTDLAFDHSFSNRTMGTVGFNYNRWDYTDSNNVDNQGMGAELQLTQAMTDRLLVGMNVSGRYRAFDETQFAPASYSTVVNSNLVIQYQITPTVRFEASGGPAGVFTEQGVPNSQWVNRWDGFEFNQFGAPGPFGRAWSVLVSPVTVCAASVGVPVLRFCPASAVAPVLTGNLGEQILIALDPGQTVFGQSRSDLTYFVNFGLTKKYSRGLLNASFIRNEDAGSGLGTTTILNSVSGSVQYSFSDFWRLDMHGVYTKRTSVSQLPFTDVSAVPAVDSNNAPITDGSGNQLAQAGYIIARTGISNLDQNVGIVEARLTRRLTERSSLQFLFTYYNQSQENQGTFTGSQFENYVGGISFIYEFDPYKF